MAVDLTGLADGLDVKGEAKRGLEGDSEAVAKQLGNVAVD